jgi:hypothetical protein
VLDRSAGGSALAEFLNLHAAPVSKRLWLPGVRDAAINRTASVQSAPLLIGPRRPLDVQADVEHPHRMGERADGEIVHAGPGVLGGGVQRKPAGRLEFGGW